MINKLNTYKMEMKEVGNQLFQLKFVGALEGRDKDKKKHKQKHYSSTNGNPIHYINT